MAFLLQRSMHVAPSVGVRRMVVPSATAAGAGADKPKVVGKAQIVEKLSERLSITKTAAGDALDALVEVITESVAADEKVTIMGFGSWERRQRAARTGRNPKTGEALQIPASFAPGFSAGKSFKDRVNGKPKAVKAPKEAAPKKAAGTAAPKAPKAPKAAPKTAAKSAAAAPTPAAKPKTQQK